MGWLHDLLRLVEKNSHKPPRVGATGKNKLFLWICMKHWKDTKISYRKCSTQIFPPVDFPPHSVKTLFDHEYAKKIGKINGKDSEGVKDFAAKLFQAVVVMSTYIVVCWRQFWLVAPWMFGEKWCVKCSLVSRPFSELFPRNCSKLNIYLTYYWLVKVVALGRRLSATLLATMCYF